MKLSILRLMKTYNILRHLHMCIYIYTYCLRQEIKATPFSHPVFFVLPITFPSKARQQQKHDHSKFDKYTANQDYVCRRCVADGGCGHGCVRARVRSCMRTLWAHSFGLCWAIWAVGPVGPISVGSVGPIWALGPFPWTPFIHSFEPCWRHSLGIHSFDDV